jgi:chemotaxis protein MotB
MKAVLIIIALVFAGAAYYFYDANKKAQSELETKIVNISKEKEEEIAKLKGTYDEFIAYMKEEIAQGQIKVIQLDDRLSVIMADKILFPSGEAEITPEGLKVLERVGSVLKNTQSKIIRVEGHTDNEQINPRLKKKYSTNWELSTARATNVVRFLQEKIGIEPEFLQPIGMSEYHPVASNETPDGRSQNRRIEIALLP